MLKTNLKEMQREKERQLLPSQRGAIEKSPILNRNIGKTYNHCLIWSINNVFS